MDVMGKPRRTSLIRRDVQALTAYGVPPHTSEDAISRVRSYTDYTGNAYIEGITPNVVRDGGRGRLGDQMKWSVIGTAGPLRAPD